MKKTCYWGLVCIFSAGLLLSACADIERDNIFDPKNPSGERESMVVAELFTTTGSNVPVIYNAYNAYARNALDSLRHDFGPRLIAFVYHRNSSQYNDLHAVPLVEPYYESYTINYIADPGRFKGVPDLFINGPAHRVQGASSSHSVIMRAQPPINDELLQKGVFTIEMEMDISGQLISGHIRIAPLGNRKSSDIRLRILLTRDDGLLQKVLLMGNPIDIGIIEKGTFKQQEFSMDTKGLAVQNIYFILRDKHTQKLLYAKGEML